MSTSASIVLSNGSDAAFRTWGSAISAALAAGGWVQTADTGQLNWLTATAAVGTSTMAGYEIWRSNDAVGLLAEIYLKIEYGNSSGSAGACALTVTVGWASDGAGNLTGTVSTRRRVDAGASGSGSAGTFNMGVGTGWICLALALDRSNTGSFGIFSVERTKNFSNVDQNELFMIATAGSAFNNQIIQKDVMTYPLEPSTVGGNTGGILAAGALGGQRYQGRVALGVILPTKGRFLSPAINIFGAGSGYLGSAGQYVYISSYGVTRRYIINDVTNNSLNFAQVGAVAITRF
jgi:hypothetical protein